MTKLTRYRVTPWVLPHQRSPVKGPCRRMHYYPTRWGRIANKLGLRSNMGISASWRWHTALSSEKGRRAALSQPGDGR